MGAFDAIVVCMSMPDFTASVTGVLSHTSDNLACWAASSDSDNVTLRSILFPAAPGSCAGPVTLHLVMMISGIT
jgi:hypothetical protein